MDTQQLIDGLLKVIPVDDREAVERGIKFALEKHEGQIRLGGEPHTHHVLRVATAAAHYARKNCPGNLLELTFSGLLHDTIEDTDATAEEIAALFGDRIARNVVALSHIEEEEPDEVYLARVAAGGRNAVLSKRFDRLDNIHALASAPTDFRARKLEEVRVALPIWQQIDPEGAQLIVAELIMFQMLGVGSARVIELSPNTCQRPTFKEMLDAISLPGVSKARYRSRSASIRGSLKEFCGMCLLLYGGYWVRVISWWPFEFEAEWKKTEAEGKQTFH